MSTVEVAEQSFYTKVLEATPHGERLRLCLECGNCSGICPFGYVTPATGLLIGTPASMSARVAPQTVAIEDEPFDSRMSDTMRIV